MNPLPASSVLQMRAVAERVIAHDDAAGPDVGFPACERLRSHLANYMGNAGAGALLARAVALAGAEVPWLRAVHVDADGSVRGDLGQSTVAPPEVVEGKIAVLAQLLALLVALIGEALTLQLALDAWPTLSLEELGLA